MNHSQLAVGNPAGVSYNYPLANMITNTVIVAVATVGYFASGAITGETPISIQSAIAIAGMVWWISNVLRRIDKRLAKFESKQERQWRMTILLMKHVFKGSEVEALMVECEQEEPTTKV